MTELQVVAEVMVVLEHTELFNVKQRQIELERIKLADFLLHATHKNQLITSESRTVNAGRQRLPTHGATESFTLVFIVTVYCLFPL